MIPDYITPGAFIKLRNGDKGRIYATDGANVNVVHGARQVDGRWYSLSWSAEGRRYHDNIDPADFVGPWIDEPDASKLWLMLPPWIEWLAMDEGGEWYGYDCPPDPEEYGMWLPDSAIVCGVPSGYAPTFAGDWTKSLIRRPKS